LVLFSLAVALGIVTTQRFKSRWWPAFASQDLHRNVSLLALSFLGIHIATILNDKYVRLGTPIPFSSPFRPVWVGLGLVSAYMLAAIVISSLVRRWLPFTAWRGLHWLTYPAWLLAVIHGAGTGSDSRTSWAAFLTAACVGSVVACLCLRIAGTDGWSALRRVTLGAGALVSTAALGAWWLAGPLSPGWPR
jgi:sulfoxide reductase heme-binding subunit YedZ